MTEGVYLALRQSIVSNDLTMGSQLVESLLAAQYKVSRTPIREALRRLEQDGLVERSTSGGLRVKVWTEDEVFDLYDVRIVLEALAARVAARRRTDIDLLRLRWANDAMAATDTHDVSEMRSTNGTFRDALWKASHNQTLVELLSRLQIQILRHPASTLTRPNRWPLIIDEHNRLIEAIERRDEDEADRLAAAHLAEARDLRLQLYAASRVNANT